MDPPARGLLCKLLLRSLSLPSQCGHHPQLAAEPLQHPEPRSLRLTLLRSSGPGASHHPVLRGTHTKSRAALQHGRQVLQVQLSFGGFSGEETPRRRTREKLKLGRMQFVLNDCPHPPQPRLGFCPAQEERKNNPHKLLAIIGSIYQKSSETTSP